jgi:hypothetical protein
MKFLLKALGIKLKCRHVYGRKRRTPYKDEYAEKCKKCGHINVFEKDYR